MSKLHEFVGRYCLTFTWGSKWCATESDVYYALHATAGPVHVLDCTRRAARHFSSTGEALEYLSRPRTLADFEAGDRVRVTAGGVTRVWVVDVSGVKFVWLRPGQSQELMGLYARLPPETPAEAA